MKSILLGATAALWSFGVFAQDIPKMTLRYSAHVPEAIYLSKVDKSFTDEITARTSGQVKFQHFWSNALGGEAEMAQLVGAGAVDVATIVTANNPSLLPLAGVTNALPMVFFDGVSAVEATKKLFGKNEAVKAEFAKANLRPLLIRHLPEYRLLCRMPIRTVEDLKGKKVRTYGAFVPQMFVALGAIPVTVLPLEMNEALQRGTVDCLYLTYATFHAFKLYQSGKYLIDVNFGAINAYTVFTSQSNWDKWPESLREIVTSAATNAEMLALESTKNAEKNALDAMLAGGAELVRFKEQDKLSAAVPDMIDLWVAKMREQGRGDDSRKIAEFLRGAK